jgi:hypothetical protein
MKKIPPRYICTKCGKSFTASNEQLDIHKAECPYEPFLTPERTMSLNSFANSEINAYVDMGCFLNPNEARPYLKDGWMLGYQTAMRGILDKLEAIGHGPEVIDLIAEMQEELDG